MMKRKYFFFDIDGTLAVGQPGRQYIPESTKYTLEKLKEAGHFVAIATGRSYAMAKEMMENMHFHNMVSDGGNGIIIEDQLIGIEPLNFEDCIALIEECQEKNIPWAFSPDNKVRRLAPDDRFYEATHDFYMKTKRVEHLNPRDYDQIYKVYIAIEKEDENKLKTLNLVPWVRFHKEYIFVEPSDKAKGIRKMVEHLHGNIEDVVVFGDEKNDLSMFKNEWTSIAMGNAIDELKERASYVTTSCDHDGIYNACVHFGWIKDEL
ncbi:Cof-type HAD-IIB family hydrolase [Kandleria vitulina]|uniref:Cof-type HAD-IIB family hydrolase n=1 Tax=Kandleria vitulina TaxID=1630 RepID=UPI000944B688|nr:Cof-type HAD-IIB family hydrolase [Kandleria vitulina]